ncbi:hypothetical protein KCU98_g10854, partial [Aureobasidium melanogenum]
MASTPALLAQAQAKKICRFAKWLLNTQNKLRTAIKGSSTTASFSSSSTTNNDAWDEMSMASASSTTTPLFSPAPTTPQTRSVSREEALRRADAYTIRRIENAYMHNTVHNPHGRRAYFRVEGY